MIKRLTEEIRAELNGKPVEDRRKDLTNLQQTGYNIRPYLEEMLACPDGIHCGPEDNGFKSITFANDTVFLYTLDDRKTTFFYKKSEDGKYQRWP